MVRNALNTAIMPLVIQLARTDENNLVKAAAMLIKIYAQHGGDAEWPFVQRNFTTLDPNKQADVTGDFIGMTARLKNVEYAQQGIGTIRDLGIAFKQFGMAPQMIEALKQLKEARLQMNDTASAKAAERAIAQINEQ